MAAPSREDRDRIVSTGEKPLKLDSSMEQPLSPKDERIVSANPSPDAVIMGPPRDVTEQPQSLDSGGDLSILPPLNAYASHDPTISYGGFGNSTGTWDGYAQYPNAADGLHVSPVIYNDNPSLMFTSGYGLNPEMAYGQYSPVATPLPSIMLDGQLFSPQHVPFSPPSFYPQHPPSAPSTAELMASESNSDNLLLGHGSGYFVHFGSYGGGVSGAPGSSPLATPAAYPQPMGILGSYEQHVGQIAQQRPLHGYGSTSTSSFGRYQHAGSHQSSKFGSNYVSYPGVNDRARHTLDKGRRRDRDQDLSFTSNDSLGFDRNRGPRASNPKGKSTSDLSSSSGIGKEDSSSSGVQINTYNVPDFVTDYENAKFFIIKSFSEDNVHKSIKYCVWASTPHGNKKLDAAYQEAKKMEGNCPVFLLFSVNASGQFCGVAEMVGPVDFEKDADYWQQDRWSGQFPVQWHIIKDVPNNQLRHILLDNNDNKPVTHSRDAQEVKQEQGIEILKIFKDYDAHTSILDDFDYYNQRERALKERKAKQHIGSTAESVGLLADGTINQISDSFAQALQMGDGRKETPSSRTAGTSAFDSALSPAHDSSASTLLAEDSAVHSFSRA